MWRRLMYVGVTFLVFLALAEAGLRIHAAVSLQRTRGGLPADRDRVILCLGDSFTYGIGAGFDESYPAHLQRMIHDRHPEGVRVVNLGHPYMDSTSLLAALPDNLEKWNPDAVLLLVGYNNRFREHAKPDAKSAELFFKRIFGRLKIYQLLRIIRINLQVDPNSRIEATVPPLEPREVAGFLATDLRYAKVAMVFEPFAKDGIAIPEPVDGDGVERQIAYGLYLMCVSRAGEAGDYFRAALKSDPGNLLATMGIGYIFIYRNELVMGFRKARFGADSAWLYAGMGFFLMDAGDYEGAVSFFAHSQKIQPYFLAAPHGMAMAYLKMGRPDDALYQLLAAEALEPWNAEVQWTKGEIYLAAGEGEKAVEAFNLSLDYSHQHPGHYARIVRAWDERPADPDGIFQETAVKTYGPRGAQWRQIGDWTRRVLAESDTSRAAVNLMEDLGDIVDVLREKKIPLILMSYPDTFYRDQLASFAKRRNVAFVDHTPVFRKILRDHDRGEIFRRDGHCTGLGYSIMAEDILKKLDEMGLSSPRPVQ